MYNFNSNLPARRDRVLLDLLKKIREADFEQESFSLSPLELSVLKYDRDRRRKEFYQDLHDEIWQKTKLSMSAFWYLLLPACVASIFIPQLLLATLLIPVITLPLMAVCSLAVSAANLISQGFHYFFVESRYLVCQSERMNETAVFIRPLKGQDDLTEWASEKVYQALRLKKHLKAPSEEDEIAELYKGLVQYAQIPEVLSLCDRLISFRELSEEDVETLRRDLQTEVSVKNEYVQRNESTLAREAYKTLLFLAEKKPLNEECPITLENIPEEDKVYLSSGNVLNIKLLVEHFNRRKDFISPLSSDLRYNDRDIHHLKRMIEKKGLKLNFISPLPTPQSFNDYSQTSSPRFFPLAHERGSSNQVYLPVANPVPSAPRVPSL